MGFRRLLASTVAALVASTLIPHDAAATDFSLITAGRKVLYKYDPVSSQGSMRFRSGPDRHLQTLGDPTICPSSSSIELRVAGSATTRQETTLALVDLPCENWKRSAAGYRYRDKTGAVSGITLIRYRSGGLHIRAESPGYTAIPGPYAFTQIKFNVEDVQYLVRLNGFRVNRADQVRSFLQSKSGHEAEAAFWDTMWGLEDRSLETIALAEKAIKRKPGDARAYFVAGMIRSYMAAAQVESWLDAGPEQIELLRGMVENMDIAMDLLWDGTTGDSRGLGFLSGGRYQLGVLTNDAEMTAQGALEVAEAVAANPVFSTFTPLGTMGPLYKGNSAEFQALVDLLDDYFPTAASQCGDQPELCFDDGFGNNNLAGTFTFFADTYAKGNRAATAEQYLTAAINIGTAGGWRTEFLTGAQDRLDNLAARVALFQDEDLSNDPPMVGSGGLNTCAWCHYR